MLFKKSQDNDLSKEWLEPPEPDDSSQAMVIGNHADVIRAFRDPRFHPYMTFAGETSMTTCPWMKLQNLLRLRKDTGMVGRVRDNLSISAAFISFEPQIRAHRYLLKCVSQRLDNLQDKATHLAETLLSGIPDQTPVDWVGRTINPYLDKLNDLLMDWPEGTPVESIRNSDIVTNFFNEGLAPTPEQVRQLNDFVRIVEEALRSPQLGKTNGLVHDLSQTSSLSGAESLANILLVHVASKHSLFRLLAGSLMLLLKEPALLRQLQQNPALIPTATDEFLRFITPQPRTLRRLSQDVLMAGVRLPAGQRVRLDFNRANRDPRVFTDPDTLNLARNPNPHVSFGHGAHLCIGQIYTKMVIEQFLSAFTQKSLDQSFHLVESTPDQHGNPYAPVRLVIRTGNDS